MLEIVLTALTILGGLCVLCTLLLGVWIMVASSRDAEAQRGWPDDDATLDVQNHRGDSRPVAR